MVSGPGQNLSLIHICYQEEYSAPDFTESAGFAVTMYPSTDILIPGLFWLINRKTAEIEYLSLIHI